MYFELNLTEADRKRLSKERQIARELRKTSWWKTKTSAGICYYCGLKFNGDHLTMDHIVPLARGGKSTKNNIVPSCKTCNDNKKLETPVERILSELANS